MLKLVSNNRSYDAEAVAAMAAAYDRVAQSFSARMNGVDERREKLAQIILRHADLGERDPDRLSDIAVRELTRNERSITG